MLNRAYGSNEAEFIVVYGRRRVGKTYLIREFFTTKKRQLFHATGLQKGPIKKQIFLALISANGLKRTIYSEEIVDGVVTLNNLFE